MGRYTQEQLQDMARRFLEAWYLTDRRALELVMRVSLLTGLDGKEVFTRIEGLANDVS